MLLIKKKGTNEQNLVAITFQRNKAFLFYCHLEILLYISSFLLNNTSKIHYQKKIIIRALN